MIRFGTAGWRGVIGDEFTFRNVRLVAQGIADSIEPEGTVVIGHDTRFLSERFAHEAGRVLTQSGHPVLRTRRDSPSPLLSFAVARERASAGITITGSHCPPEFNGLKLYAAGGVPASRELTDRIERRVAERERDFVDRYAGADRATRIDPTEDYLERLATLVDLEAIAGSGLRIAVDPLFGTAHEILDRLLVQSGARVEVLHNFRDSGTAGYSPAFSVAALEPLRATVVDDGCDLGLATDTDADRFAVIDSDGTILDAHDLHALLADYLLAEGRCRGDLARSVATSHYLDSVAEAHGVAIHETAVGFRHLGPLLDDGRAEMGFEESAGFGWGRHLPDKDGILACLLVAEISARSEVPLRERIHRLRQQHGAPVHLRRDYPLDDDRRERLDRAFARPPGELAGRRVQRTATTDGFKLHFGDSWFLYRRSGTKSVLRCHAEAPTRSAAETLHEAGRQYLFETT